MNRFRSLPAWALGCLGGVVYCVLWWGGLAAAAGIAVASTDRREEDSTVERLAEGVGALLVFAALAILALIVVHVLYAVFVAIAVPAARRLGRFGGVVVVVLLGGVVLPLAAAGFGSPIDRLLLLAGTLATPTAATWWLAARPATADPA